jgi:hypothetical protein
LEHAITHSATPHLRPTHTRSLSNSSTLLSTRPCRSPAPPTQAPPTSPDLQSHNPGPPRAEALGPHGPALINRSDSIYIKQQTTTRRKEKKDVIHLYPIVPARLDAKSHLQATSYFVISYCPGPLMSRGAVFRRGFWKAFEGMGGGGSEGAKGLQPTPPPPRDADSSNVAQSRDAVLPGSKREEWQPTRTYNMPALQVGSVAGVSGFD